MILLEELIYESHILGQVTAEGDNIPIPSFVIPNLSDFALVINSSSDDDTEAYSAGKFTITYPSEQGEVLGNESYLYLGEYQAFLVDGMAESFSLKVDVSYWLKDVRLKIWKGKETMPQSPISPTSGSRTSIPQTPITTAAANTATQIAPALVGRNKLTIHNEANAPMRIRYAAVGTGTSATATVYDEIIASGYLFEYPATDFPETAINAIWIPASGVTLSGNCTVTQGIRG